MAVTKWASTVDASTAYKNSGWLRYQIGGNKAGNVALNGQAGISVHCLGDAALTTPDMDNQLFGMTVGHDAIVAPVNSLFASLSTPGVVACNVADIGNEAGTRFPPYSTNAGAATGQARTKAAGRIPAGTKCRAFFEAVTFAQGGSTTPDETPQWYTQIEYVFNAIRVSGTIQTAQPQWISSIRVALFNNGASGSTTALQGILYVELQHSLLDLPGSTAAATDQSIIPSTAG
jgi:hypothetical protein